LTSGPTELLIESVLNYDIEGAFVAGPIEHPLLDISAIIEEELVLVSQSENMPLSWSSTEQQLTFVSFRNGCSYRKRLELYLDHLGIQSRKVIELGTLDGILGCVSAGLGITLVPKKVIDQGKHSLYCQTIPPNFGKVPTVFIHRKNSFVSPALKRFIVVLHENNRVLL
jgi:DNA-binding transcriptional LysR family regulator